ncbi:MAG: hypothetical protein HN742_22330 [Lentisphaerae bacterium]|jgi:hypothetical protein|nr:hypothetical protein [Lentisphaerota bacterium]MBT4814829.1 hypothetical protein [Lentisphaerota bacterium]MBT5604964.1 hypothetical protein [Lentisphaerota bacterium]MBT7055968.1 hypothetical protein [Lentisphaerota bacterium]MBT7844631.1 hypothetical protein [Lentisphaerota bacterium]
MDTPSPIVYFAKMVQAFPLIAPVQRLTGGVFVSTRGSTIRAFRRQFPDLVAHRYWRVASRLSSGWHDLQKATVIVAGAPHTKLLKPLPGRKVMIFHGCTNHFSQGAIAELLGFDHVLLQGPRMARMLRRNDPEERFSYSVPGYVPFDCFPRPSVEGRRQQLLSLGLDPSLQTIVYTPTRSIYGSWCQHAEAIASQVSEEFNLILRPHPHQAVCGNSEERASFRAVSTVLRTRRHAKLDLGECSLGEVLSVADLLISDTNSTAEESLFYDVPQLFTESYSREMWVEQYAREGVDQESVEALLSFYDCGLSFSRLGVDSWDDAVRQALAAADELAPVRQAYFASVFGPRSDRPVARNVADELMEMVSQA